MRNIIVTEYLTLDGVFEAPGHWSFDYFNDEAMQYKRDELFSSDVQLLGRVTYEGFAKAWPTMPDNGDFGDRMNSMPKYVFSTTLTHAECQNSTQGLLSCIISLIEDSKDTEGVLTSKTEKIGTTFCLFRI